MAEFIMNFKYYLTRKGISNLAKKQQQLVQEIESSTKAMGKSADLDNDLRENPEFMQLRTKVTYELPRKISDIEAVIKHAIIIDDMEAIKNQEFHEVMPGMMVELESETGDIRTHSILGFEEGDPALEIVSYLSPVGQALLHKSVGDEVTLMLNGEKVNYEILNIYLSPYIK